jgi:hypothetical protein
VNSIVRLAGGPWDGREVPLPELGVTGLAVPFLRSPVGYGTAVYLRAGDVYQLASVTLSDGARFTPEEWALAVARVLGFEGLEALS